MNRFKRKRLLLGIFFFTALKLFCQEEESAQIPFTGEEPPSKIVSLSKSAFPRIEYPKIMPPRSAKSEEEAEAFRVNNEIWQQYQKDLELYNKIKNYPKKLRRGIKQPESLFYIYEVKKDEDKYLDTFNGLYARFQTRQGTLASINRLSSPGTIEAGKEIILPVMQGLFIPENPESTLETLLQKESASKITEDTAQYEIDGSLFYFLPDLNFSPTTLAFFHDTGMQLPLSKKIVTSEFGYRTSPISGTWKFHAGIDLAAPIGTEVYACKSGLVKTVAFSEIYGNYIVLLHNGNKTSLYAHLSEILVKNGDRVSTGQVIGKVGTTGASTGPHLHFEVRENGKATDPEKLF